jgi:hypothetical protein
MKLGVMALILHIHYPINMISVEKQYILIRGYLSDLTIYDNLYVT